MSIISEDIELEICKVANQSIYCEPTEEPPGHQDQPPLCEEKGEGAIGLKV